MNDLLRKASAIAEEVLFPAAGAVDASGLIPESHFRLLAEEGFHGLIAPRELGGQGADFETFLRVVETLAGGCLATAFTWLQHHGVVMGLAMTPNTALREGYLDAAVRGELTGGAAFSGVVQTPARVRATRSGDGWTLTGQIPFVSGWGVVDVLQLSAADENGDIVSCLIDAKPAEGIEAVHALDLVAGQATSTVRLDLRDLWIPDTKVTTRTPLAEFVTGMVPSLRVDGSLPLGLAGRAAALTEAAGQEEAAAGLRAEAAALRAKFDAAMAEPAELPAMRASASEFAVRATGTAVVATGSQALLTSHAAQRLAREALFTLVVASRPAVKSGLLRLLSSKVDSSV
ncbi:acyl-CoA dehydrogenase family protein [Amycolatopsis sp. cg5]|uniref:acyl-CoA dehydrogenase family protein n=1 Tax=Amycolatopsis sp. cg5 TaxID=3238802 RepID=UPI0035236321